MKNITLALLLSILIISVSYSQSSKDERENILENIKSEYAKADGYAFGYGLKTPVETSLPDLKGNTFSFDKKENCTGQCLCNSLILYKDKNQASAELFSISDIRSINFLIEEKRIKITLSESEIILTYPDTIILEKIYNDLQQLYKLCM